MIDNKDKNQLIYYYGVAILADLVYFLINYKIIYSSKFHYLNMYSLIFPIIFSSIFIFKGIKQNVTKRGNILSCKGETPFVPNRAGEWGPIINQESIPGDKNQNEFFGSLYIWIGALILFLFFIINILMSY